MRLNKSDLVLLVLQLFMHSMAQEPVLKITSPKEYCNRFFVGGFLFLIRDFFPLLDFFHYLHCFVLYILVYLAQYIYFFHYKIMQNRLPSKSF